MHIWRRSYDVPPPGGESLRDTGARVWPYYLTEILRAYCVAKRFWLRHMAITPLAGHVLDKLTKEQILGVNLATGVPMVTTERRLDRRFQGSAGRYVLRRTELT